MTQATTYTVTDHNGEVLGRRLSLAGAADLILSDDSREWEIREREDGGFQLWSRQQVASRPWSACVPMSFADTREEAEAEIFAEVVAASWPNHPEAMTDEAYDRMLAEMEAE